MNKNNENYPPLNNLEGMEVVALLKLRQQIREVRDNIRTSINEEISAKQDAIRREGIIDKRTFDLQLNELKRQQDENNPTCVSPEGRIRASVIRDNISELKYKFSIAQNERDRKINQLANERQRRNSQNQLEYEELELKVCKVIRDKDGFRQYGYGMEIVPDDNQDKTE